MKENVGRRRPRASLVVVAVIALLVLAVSLGAWFDVPRGRGAAETLPLAREGTSVSSRDAREAPRQDETKAVVATVGTEIEFVPDQLLVKFEKGTTRAAAAGVLSRVGVREKTAIGRIGVRVVKVSPDRREQALAGLKSSPHVEYAERDIVMEQVDIVPNDVGWPSQWGARAISAPRAWDTTQGSDRVVIAILDTGADFAHLDLRGAFVPGYDVVNNDPDPRDDQGHGTSVAGVVAARSNNGEGIAGICWACTLMPIKVLDAAGRGTTVAIAKGMVWATDNGAKVINMSLGGPGTTQALTDAIAYVEGKDVTMVAAAGNEGSTTMFYPAAYRAVISVAASDDADRLYPWSNRGAWVKVAAPGCNPAPLNGGGYRDFCGTSSATPVVSGLAGLTLAAKPTASRAEIEQAVKSTAKAIGAEVQYGRVDAAGTLFALGVSTPATPPPSATTPVSISATYVGKITPSSPSRTYRRTIGAGRLTARLSFTGARSLTITVVGPGGSTIARLSGASPLRVARKVGAGKVRFRVSGRNVTASFRVVVSYRPA